METAAPNASANFRVLALQVREAGLFTRRPRYDGVKIALTIATYVCGWVAFVIVGNSWDALALGVCFGLLYTQLGFLGHDAGHHQIFGSPRANRLLGLTVGNAMIGLSFGWWVPKHCAHHAHPNEPGRDPDVVGGMFSSNGERAGRWSIPGMLTRWQAPLFFPLMLLRSTGLHVSGVHQLLHRRDRAAITEATLLVLHAAMYLTLVFVVLSPLKALAFVAVQQAVFSVYLGCSFAPNHKAMPLIQPGTPMSFARRQVLTASNVTGGRALTFALGGLNYQIEHHLFPSMPRSNLRRAQGLVKEFCAQSQLEYCEVSLVESFRRIIRHLRIASTADDGPDARLPDPATDPATDPVALRGVPR